MHDTRGQDVPAEAFMRYRAAAAHIGMSESWLRKQVRAGTAPHYKFGKTVAFSAEHIAAILAAHERQPKPSAPLRATRRRAG